MRLAINFCASLIMFIAGNACAATPSAEKHSTDQPSYDVKVTEDAGVSTWTVLSYGKKIRETTVDKGGLWQLKKYGARGELILKEKTELVKNGVIKVTTTDYADDGTITVFEDEITGKDMEDLPLVNELGVGNYKLIIEDKTLDYVITDSKGVELIRLYLDIDTNKGTVTHVTKKYVPGEPVKVKKYQVPDRKAKSARKYDWDGTLLREETYDENGKPLPKEKSQK